MAGIAKETTIIKAEKRDIFFVDRQNPRETFRTEYEALEGKKDSCSTIYYYGIGGIGKSTLLENIEKCGFDQNKPFYKHDYGNTANIIEVLYSLRTQMLESKLFKFAFPRFDYAVYKYENTITEQHKLASKDKEGNALEKGTSILSSLVSIFQNTKILEKTSETISMIIDFATICKNTYDLYIGEKEENDLSRFASEFDKLLASENKSGKREIIIKKIVEAFKDDMNMSTERFSSEYFPILIELDTVEKSKFYYNVSIRDINTEETGKAIEYDLDLLLGEQGLCKSAKGVLWVLAGRDPLAYEDSDYFKQEAIKGLDDSFIRELLENSEIKNKDIQDQIIKTVEGIPTYIDICINIYNKKNGQVTADDFKGGIAELTERYIKYIKDPIEKSIIFMMATIQRWDDELFNLYLSEYDDRDKDVYTNKYEDLLKSSFITSNKDNRRVFHEVVRNAIYISNEYSKKNKNNDIEMLLKLIDKKIENEPEKYIKLIFAIINNEVEQKESCLSKENLIRIKDILKKDMNYPVFAMDGFGYCCNSLYELAKKTLQENDISLAGFEYLVANNYNRNLHYEETVKFIKEKVSYYLDKEIYSLEVVDVCNELASGYMGLDKYDETYEIDLKLEQMIRKANDTNTKEFILVLNGLAIDYDYIGKKLESVELNKQAYDIAKHILSSDSPLLLKTRKQVALDLNYFYQDKQACIKELEEILKIKKEKYGDSLETKIIEKDLAHCNGDIIKKESICKEVLEYYKNNSLGINQDSIRIQREYAKALMDNKKYDDSLKVYEDIHKYHKDNKNTSIRSKAKSLSDIGECKNRSGKHTEAFYYLKEAYEMYDTDCLDKFYTLGSLIRCADKNEDYKLIHSKANEYMNLYKNLIRKRTYDMGLNINFNVFRSILWAMNVLKVDTKSQFEYCSEVLALTSPAKKDSEQYKYIEKVKQKLERNLDLSSNTVLKHDDKNEILKSEGLNYLKENKIKEALNILNPFIKERSKDELELKETKKILLSILSVISKDEEIYDEIQTKLIKTYISLNQFDDEFLNVYFEKLDNSIGNRSLLDFEKKCLKSCKDNEVIQIIELKVSNRLAKDINLYGDKEEAFNLSLKNLNNIQNISEEIRKECIDILRKCYKDYIEELKQANKDTKLYDAKYFEAIGEKQSAKEEYSELYRECLKNGKGETDKAIDCLTGLINCSDKEEKIEYCKQKLIRLNKKNDMVSIVQVLAIILQTACNKKIFDDDIDKCASEIRQIMYDVDNISDEMKISISETIYNYYTGKKASDEALIFAKEIIERKYIADKEQIRRFALRHPEILNDNRQLIS